MKGKTQPSADPSRDVHARLVRRLALIASGLAIVFAVLLLTDRLPPDDNAQWRESRDREEEDFAAKTKPPIAPRVRVRVQKRPPRDAKERAPSGANSAPGGEAEPEVDARDYIAALREAGETEGIAAFSPPGTRPPKSGIIVPEDYVLPEGYARYYQSTDDGRRLPPILSVSPGYDLIGPDGKRVPLPPERIVPPEYAPPGLPVRILEIPSPTGRADDRR